MKVGLSILLTLLVSLEIACQFTIVATWDKAMNSIVYFVTGILIGIVPLFKTRSEFKVSKTSQILNWLFIAIGFASLLYLIQFLQPWGRDIFNYHTLNYKKADMLPIIARMCKRFLDNEWVYEIIPLWDGTEPIYLPAMWLPYVPFSYFAVDIRWANLLFLLFGWCFIYTIGGIRQFSWRFILLGIPVYFLFQNLFFEDYRLIYMTEEPMVIGYYLLLAFALVRKNTLLIGIALSLCLMSRFALVFWMIMYLAILFLEHRDKAIKIFFIVAVICLVLLFSTQAIWQLDVILGLPSTYLEHLQENEWKYNSFTNNHLGLVKFFAFEHLETFHQLFFALSILVPTLSFAVYYYYKFKINQAFFAICTLKLCLVCFYNFLIMPFLYLFYTSTFLSLAILSFYLKNEK